MNMDGQEEGLIGLNSTQEITKPNNACVEVASETICFTPYASRPETYIVPLVFGIIFFVGLIGNGTLIFIYIKDKTMRNVPNMYIMSLAVGDLSVILFCVPFTSILYTVESWPFGEFICKFSEFTKDLSVGVSVFTLAALSVERYLAIKYPLRNLQGGGVAKKTFVTISGIWILSTLMVLPSALLPYIKVIDDHPTRTFDVCYPFPIEFGETFPKVMVMYHFLGYYCIPLGFIATFYTMMARTLIQSTRNIPGDVEGQAKKQIQSRKNVAKMILSIVLIFALCFLPQHVFYLWFYFSSNSNNNYNQTWHTFRIIGFCLNFSNSCVNPIMLYIFSGTFHEQFNKTLFFCCCKREGEQTDNSRR